MLPVPIFPERRWPQFRNEWVREECISIQDVTNSTMTAGRARGPSSSLPSCSHGLSQPSSSFDGADAPPRKSNVSLPIRERRSQTHLDPNPKTPPESPPQREMLSQSEPRFERGRTLKRRCVSADVAYKARQWFSSPDRFIPLRSPPSSTERPIHSSRSPQGLSPRERYTRSRDHSQDPFRTPISSRSRDAVRRRPLVTDRRSTPPHVVPDFVHANNQSSLQRDPRGVIDIPRQISAGGVWNVGGRGAAQGGPLPGVPDGSGGLLSSGSNAPMYTAQFLDQENQNMDLQRHENRLAIALDIDPASRVLSPRSSPLQAALHADRPMESRDSPFLWRDGAWTREHGLYSKFVGPEIEQKRCLPIINRILELSYHFSCLCALLICLISRS